MHTGGSDPPAPGDLDLSWSFSGMSVSGSMSHRLPHDLEGGLDASGLGLEIVGKSISGLGGSFGGGGGGGGGGSGHHHARAPAGSMGPPLSSATPARPPPLAFPTHMQSHVPSASVVAQQLHHVSESFKTGLISPEERSMWKDHIITRASGEGDGDSRFGRGGVIDDVLLTGRDDFEGEPFSGSLGSSAFRK